MGFTLHGIGVSDGIAIGRAHLVSHTTVEVPHYAIADRDIDNELSRFDNAIRATRKELEMLWGSIPENAPAELGAFLSLHIMLLNDATLSREPRQIIEKQKCNAEWAMKQQRDILLAQFDEIEESYLRERRADIIQVVDRIFKSLAGQPLGPHIPTDRAQNCILVAHDFSPADMVMFKDTQFAAFITDVGGATSHTAILARSLNIPSVLALHTAHATIQEEEWVIVDGSHGVVIVGPDERVLAEYKKKQSIWLAERKRLRSLKSTVTQSMDGVAVDLLANIELPSDLDQVKAAGAAGVGLFRSEFLFMGRDTLPDEEEQFIAYRTVAEEMKGRSVVVRTLDLGADKNPKWATHGVSLNPALGLCGIRLCLAEPMMFQTQLRAMLRASHYGNLSILVPMLTSLPELYMTFSHIQRVKAQLDEEGIPYNREVKIGGMIEVPAAALMAASYVRQLDFVSLGTNDLIQYTLAIDRGDDAVSHLYDPLHPAVLQLIAQTIRAADKAGKPVSVCGEMAGDPMLTRILLGMGLRKFSMHPAHLLKVKSEVLRTDIARITPLVQRLLKAEEPERMAELIDKIDS